MYKNKYTHGFVTTFNYLGLLLIIAPIIRIVILIIEVIIAHFRGDLSSEIGVWIIYFILLVISFVFAVVIAANVYNYHSEFIVEDEGIYVRLFNYWFFWKLIPWEKVISVRPSPRNKNIWILSVERYLTIWHKFFKNPYGFGTNSEIVILKSLENREDFISSVKKRIQAKEEQF